MFGRVVRGGWGAVAEVDRQDVVEGEGEALGFIEEEAICSAYVFNGVKEGG